jgi:serine/threonine protein kinase
MPELEMPDGTVLERYNLLFTEFMRNGSVLDLLVKANDKKRRLSTKSQKFLIKSLCQAYQHLLRVDEVAHRDIKPDNLMLTDCMKVAFIDFGHSKKLNSQDGSVYQKTGTPGYRAFEVIQGKAYCLEKADIFALAATIFVILFQTLPFGFMQETDNGNEYYRCIREGRIGDFYGIFDPTPVTSQEVFDLRILLAWCFHPNPAFRPAIEHLLEASFIADAPDDADEEILSELLYILA